MIRLQALHLVARVALRMLPPRRAKRLVEEAARALPRVGSLDEARSIAAELDRSGTCLSRALTLAPCVPGSTVVIGVDPGREHSMLYAHAWIEVDGEPLRPSDPRGQEIARL